MPQHDTIALHARPVRLVRRKLLLDERQGTREGGRPGVGRAIVQVAHVGDARALRNRGDAVVAIGKPGVFYEVNGEVKGPASWLLEVLLHEVPDLLKQRRYFPKIGRLDFRSEFPEVLCSHAAGGCSGWINLLGGQSFKTMDLSANGWRFVPEN